MCSIATPSLPLSLLSELSPRLEPSALPPEVLLIPLELSLSKSCFVKMANSISVMTSLACTGANLDERRTSVSVNLDIVAQLVNVVVKRLARVSERSGISV
uniref:Uncharacterized protein n=1 Tax=Corethron hystrix TaxID=216773 RepID=A0A7S1BHG3_9STRA